MIFDKLKSGLWNRFRREIRVLAIALLAEIYTEDSGQLVIKEYDSRSQDNEGSRAARLPCYCW